MRLGFTIAGLGVVMVTALAAQNAVIQNAASAPNTTEIRTGADQITLAQFIFPYALQGFQSAVAPGMLAEFSYDNATGYSGFISAAVVRVPEPNASAAVSIRPWGSTTAFNTQVVTIGTYGGTFVVPRNLPLGGAEVEYKIGSRPTAWTNVNVVPASFDFFRIVPGGPVIAQSVAANGALNAIGLATPAQPGQTVRLTGSGLGNGTSFTLTVGGVPAAILTAQPHRATPGTDEILFQMPAPAPDGCYVPLAFTYGNTTVTSTISKSSNGGPCSHPFQLSTADLQMLDSGGYIAVGLIDMDTTLNVVTPAAASRDEGADVFIEEWGAADLAGLFPPASPAGCTVASYGAPEFVLAQGVLYSPNPPTPPNPGLMTLQNGNTTLSSNDGYLNLPATTEGPLTNPPTPVIAGGKWTWSSGGSTDLAPSSFSFTLPSPIQLNGAAPISIVRGQGQTLTWNGAAFDAGAVLAATLSVGDTYITCTAPANNGSLTVPSSLFGQFGAASIGEAYIVVTETPSYIPHALFKLKNGNTLVMFVNYSAAEYLPVDFE